MCSSACVVSGPCAVCASVPHKFARVTNTKESMHLIIKEKLYAAHSGMLQTCMCIYALCRCTHPISRTQMISRRMHGYNMRD